MKTLIALVLLLSLATVGTAKVYVKNMTVARKKYSSSSSSLYSMTKSDDASSDGGVLRSAEDSSSYSYYSSDSSYDVMSATKWTVSDEWPRDDDQKKKEKEKEKKKKKKKKKDKDRRNKGNVLDLSGTIREKFAFLVILNLLAQPYLTYFLHVLVVLLSVATVGIAKVYVKNMTAAARKKYSSSSSSLYSETRSTSSDSLLLSSDDSDLYYSDDSDSSSALYSYSVYHTKYPPIASNELPKDENYKDRYKDKKKKKKKKIKKKKNKNRKKDKDRKNRGKVLDLSGTIREKFAFAAMSSRSSESVVCSPTAAIFPAGMLIFGAEGSALSELLKGVGIRSRSDAHSKLKEVRKHFEKVPGIDVMVASRMYLSNRKKLRSRFQEEAESVFHACTAYVDMKQPSSAVQSINSWVSRTTGGQIHNFMRDNDVPVDGSLVLVNAISFKGKWKYPFKKLYKVPFHGSRGREDMGMMYIKEDFMHGTSYKLDAQIVEIPYRDNGAKFMIILPHSLNGLNLLVSQLKLAPELLNSVILEKKKVNVYLPRFKITSSLNLRSMYKMVDIKRIFRDHDSSGLNKVVKDETIFVDNGIQKVTIDVNDDGTTGGVVSEMGGGMTGGMTGGDLSIVVKCDHPFMFFVLWKKEQLFAGTFTN